MIPKKIHYCWFGGNPLPELAQKCIASWKKYCPDYEIIEWNETNYDITKNNYMNQAYENKRWGFVPDYARLDIIYTHGGIYLDTDVELIKPIDELLTLKAFAGVEQNSEYVALGLGFGAEKEHPTIKALRDYYDTLSFVENGELGLDESDFNKNASLYFRRIGYKCCYLPVDNERFFFACDNVLFLSASLNASLQHVTVGKPLNLDHLL